MSPLDKTRELATCSHPAPFHIGERAEWCSSCGALRYSLERPSGSLASLEWFRPTGVTSIDEMLGRALSFYADRCLSFLQKAPAPLTECAERFGTGAMLELVFRDLVDVGDDGVAFVNSSSGEAPSGSRLRVVKAAER